MTDHTITRAQLSEVTERLIFNWRDSINDDEIADLRRIARTVKRLATGPVWWSVDENCGCLVGSIHGADTLDDAKLIRPGILSEGMIGLGDHDFLGRPLTVID